MFLVTYLGTTFRITIHFSASRRNPQCTILQECLFFIGVGCIFLLYKISCFPISRFLILRYSFGGMRCVFLNWRMNVWMVS